MGYFSYFQKLTWSVIYTLYQWYTLSLPANRIVTFYFQGLESSTQIKFKNWSYFYSQLLHSCSNTNLSQGQWPPLKWKFLFSHFLHLFKTYYNLCVNHLLFGRKRIRKTNTHTKKTKAKPYQSWHNYQKLSLIKI